jgi:hypothetical protein
MFMAARTRRILLTLASGSVLAVAPLTFAFAAPAPAHADCNAPRDGQPAPQNNCDGPCPDNKVRSGVSGDCVDQMTSLGEQLQRLPPPPGWDGQNIAGINGSGLNGLGIPSPVQVNMPDLVLPSVGLGLVPNLVVQPNFGGISAPQAPDLTQLPAPQLPDLTKIPPPQPPSLTHCGPTLGPFTPCI